MLLLVGCARNNPEFGLEGGAGTVADDGGDRGTAGDGGPLTEGADDDTTGAGEGSASGGTTDAVVPETSTSAGGTDDDDPDSGESGTVAPCEKMMVAAMLDTFVDGTFACAGPCAASNFGGTGTRRVGTEGPGSPASVYLVELAPAAIRPTQSVEGARLHVPLAMEPQAGATAMLFPVSPVIFFGTGDGEPERATSTWNHQVATGELWPDPAGAAASSDFGLVLSWAMDSGNLVETQLSLDDLIEGDGAPFWAEVELGDDLLTPLQSNLHNGADIRFGFTVDSLSAQWVVRALDSGDTTAYLDVEVCG